MEWLKTNGCDNTLVPQKLFPWSTFFLFGIWHLWLQRNEVLFQHPTSNSSLSLLVENSVMEFICCVQVPSGTKYPIIKPVRWEKPDINWSKLNTDGSARSFPGLAGSGGLIRNYAGDWVSGFARNIGITGSAKAELWALRDGLTLCLQLRLPAVVVELDAQAIVNILSSSNSYNGDLCPLVDDCRELLRQIPQTKVLHCFREANFCADAMAKLGSMLEQDFILFTTPPPLLFPLLEFDKKGLFCNRQGTVTLVT